MSSDNFFTVSQVNAMSLSNVGSKITKPVYFKIMSDRDLKQHNVLLVADSDKDQKDQMEIEFDPEYLREMARRGSTRVVWSLTSHWSLSNVNQPEKIWI